MSRASRTHALTGGTSSSDEDTGSSSIELKRGTNEPLVLRAAAPTPLSVSDVPLDLSWQDVTIEGNALAIHYRVRLLPIIRNVVNPQCLAKLDTQVLDLVTRSGEERIAGIPAIKEQLQAELAAIERSIVQEQEKIDSKSCCCGPLGKKEREAQARVTADYGALRRARNLVVRLDGVIKEEKRGVGIPVEETDCDLDVPRLAGLPE